ncbi:MAG: PD40 domain-containing protein [Bradymonadales bacterium]|nr:PD40 domain-containing protein [Bradymonadales bacterium]
MRLPLSYFFCRQPKNHPGQALLPGFLLASLSSLLLLASSAIAQQPPPPTGPTLGNDIGAIEILIDPTVNPRVRTPLAVPDALNLGTTDLTNVAATISRTLRRDLELAGHFQILSPASYFFDQHADGLTSSTINFQNWFNVGAQGLVKTGFSVAANQVRLDFRLFNVDAGQQVSLEWQPVTVSLDHVPQEVHRFANEVIYYYSGYHGPLGSRIAFVGRGAEGSREIYTLTLGADGISPITSNNSINTLPAWVGNNIAFTTYINGNPDLVLTDGDGFRVLSERPGQNVAGSASPDGSELAVTLTIDSNAEIYVISTADGSILRRLTDNLAEDVSPIWSPRGNRIAFVSDRSGNPQIYLMNADGADQRRITFAGNYNTTPAWSPDGTTIAFTGRDSRNRFDIFTVDVASSHIERLTQDQGNNECPSYSPDGQYIVFSSDRGGGNNRLYIMTADGNFQTLLTRQGNGYNMPVWRN